ncbi:MAG: hypothetical protein V3U57_03665 [Robiginitomaculum sp.]
MRELTKIERQEISGGPLPLAAAAARAAAKLFAKSAVAGAGAATGAVIVKEVTGN